MHVTCVWNSTQGAAQHADCDSKTDKRSEIRKQWAKAVWDTWMFSMNIENHLISGALFPTPFKHNPKLRTRPLEKGTSPAVGARRAQSLHNAEIWSWWRGAFQAAHAWWPRWFSSRWSCGSQLKWGTHRGRGGPAEWTTGETQPVAFTPHLQRGSWRSTEDVFLSTKHRAALGD